MLRCTKAHTVEAFGEIPVGSLWDDDSPYVGAKSKFEKVKPDPDPQEDD